MPELIIIEFNLGFRKYIFSCLWESAYI